MERRRFLKYGIASAGGAAALGSSGCVGAAKAGSTKLQAPPPVPDLDDYIARIDTGMAKIETFRMADILKSKNLSIPAGIEDEDQRIQDSLKALFLTGMYGDLPEEARLHPGIQARIRDNSDLMDRAILKTIDFLQSRTQSENAALRAALGQRGNPGMQVGEEMDNFERDLGMSFSRRMQTRNLFAQASYRLARQNPGTVYREYIQKVEKLAANRGAVEGLNRQLGSRAGEKVFWDQTRNISKAPGGKDSPGRMILNGAEEDGKSGGPGLVGIGLIVLALSGVVGLLGAVGIGLIGATVGAILLIIGIIAAIVGAIVKQSQ